jgi:hypothetical protein
MGTAASLGRGSTGRGGIEGPRATSTPTLVVDGNDS